MIPQWHLVAHASELEQPGDYVCLPRQGHPDTAVMNFDGEIVAFDNRCPHRGARIFTDLRGNRPPVCGYHGRCARPADVARMRTAWIGDWLFVGPLWSNEVGPRHKDSPVAEFLKGSPRLAPHSTSARIYDCHWTTAVENSLDSEHVEHVHGASLASLGLQRASLWTEGDGSSLEVFHSAAAPRLNRLAKSFHETRPFDYAHAHVNPFAAVASTRGWTYSMQHYLPQADGRTAFISRLFVQADALSRGAVHFFAAVAAMNKRVFDEDADICAIVPRAGGVCHLGPRDDRVRHFRFTGARHTPS